MYAYLFEITAMQPHVAVEGGYVLELPVTQVTFYGFQFRFGSVRSGGGCGSGHRCSGHGCTGRNRYNCNSSRSGIRRFHLRYSSATCGRFRGRCLLRLQIFAI